MNSPPRPDDRDLSDGLLGPARPGSPNGLVDLQIALRFQFLSDDGRLGWPEEAVTAADRVVQAISERLAIHIPDLGVGNEQVARLDRPGREHSGRGPESGP